MAKGRNRNLAGLAGLAALGAVIAEANKSKDKVELIPEDRVGTPVESILNRAAPAAASDTRDYSREIAEHGSGIGLTAEDRAPAVATPGGKFQATRSIAKPYTRPESLTDLTREMNRGQRGPIATPMEREPASVSSRKPNVIYDAEGKEVRPLKKGGAVKMASGGSVSSASKRGDGIAQRGKTRGRLV